MVEIELSCRREPDRQGRSRFKIQYFFKLVFFLYLFSALPGQFFMTRIGEQREGSPTLIENDVIWAPLAEGLF